MSYRQQVNLIAKYGAMTELYRRDYAATLPPIGPLSVESPAGYRFGLGVNGRTDLTEEGFIIRPTPTPGGDWPNDNTGDYTVFVFVPADGPLRFFVFTRADLESAVNAIAQPNTEYRTIPWKQIVLQENRWDKLPQ
jgi:hypothetical protein